MNKIHWVVLAIYAPFFVLMLLVVAFFLAPMVAGALGLDRTLTTALLLALSVASGGWTIRSILQDKQPLARLGKVLSARPNSGSQGMWNRPPADPAYPPSPVATPVPPPKENHKPIEPT